MNQSLETVVDQAFESLVAMLPPDSQLPAGPDQPLLESDGGPLDSLAVVNLMVTVEAAVARGFGVRLSLAPALAEPPDTSPFRSRSQLYQYLSDRLSDHRVAP